MNPNPKLAPNRSNGTAKSEPPHKTMNGRARSKKAVLITGGAGFIGSNLADRLLTDGQPVLVYDNLARPGVEENLKWLREKHGSLLSVEIADTRDAHSLALAVRHASAVFHFAAQVAVTSSLLRPAFDFEVNTRGTLNLLEALRTVSTPTPLIFTSTNKVYGSLRGMELRAYGTRYEPVEAAIRAKGVNELQPLEFHSPYGCSKGAADQYVQDYARSFGLPAIVFRMSCIYGPHQLGTEDQGWLAHFLLRALSGEALTLYGDGMQVRDVLFISDLINAFLLAKENAEALAGEAFNIGGGPHNTTSLLELLDLISELGCAQPTVQMADWRAGDQRYYVSDISKFRAATGWTPEIDVRDGVQKLYNLFCESKAGVSATLAPATSP